MNVGIINSYKNTTAQNKQPISFQKAQSEQWVLKMAYTTLAKKEQNPTVLTNILNQVLELFEESNIASRAVRFQFDCAKEQKIILNQLESDDLKTQKMALKNALKLLSQEKGLDSKVASTFMWKKVVPFVKKMEDRKLAQYILDSTKPGETYTSIKTIKDRIEFIKELGDKSHIEELEGYATSIKPGILDREDARYPVEVHQTKKYAQEVLRFFHGYKI